MGWWKRWWSVPIVDERIAELEVENKRLRETLKWYAGVIAQTCGWDVLSQDKGQRAREALREGE